MILGKFTKQPADVQDYDISYADWLADLSDTAVSAAVTISGPDTSATIVSSLNAPSGIVKVWVTGGTSGSQYKVTSTLTTTGGRIKQAEITVKVKEV